MNKWKCNACSRPCVLIVDDNDGDPESCPYSSSSFDEWLAEPKAPTHEEIMKPRFWQMDNENYWRAITGVRVKENGDIQYLMYDGWCDGLFFIGRESADIPPEEG